MAFLIKSEAPARKAGFGLPREEEFELARRWRERGDVDARNKIVAAHRSYAISIVYKEFSLFQGKQADMIGEGFIGLVEAANRFDPGRGVRFTTYSGFWIRAFIFKYLIANTGIIRLGKTDASRRVVFFLAKARRDLAKAGREPTNEELAAYLGVPLKILEDMLPRMGSRHGEVSINAPLYSDDPTRSVEPVDPAPLPDQAVEDASEQERNSFLVRLALCSLKPAEREIIRLRFLMEKPLTMEEIGNRLQISRERVRQIEWAARPKIKKRVQVLMGKTRKATRT